MSAYTTQHDGAQRVTRDPLRIAAELERARQRVEDARASFAVAGHRLLTLPHDPMFDALRAETRAEWDVRRAELMNERAEHVRLVAELVALAEKGESGDE